MPRFRARGLLPGHLTQRAGARMWIYSKIKLDSLFLFQDVWSHWMNYEYKFCFRWLHSKGWPTNTSLASSTLCRLRAKFLKRFSSWSRWELNWYFFYAQIPSGWRYVIRYGIEIDQVFFVEIWFGVCFFQSALDGYTIYAFLEGVHTMYAFLEGVSGMSRDQRGIIPRSVEQVFSTGQDLLEKGWKVGGFESYVV